MRAFLILFTLICIAFPCLSQEDGIAKHFGKYISQSNFEHTYVSNRMLSAILKSNANDLNPNSKDLMKEIKGMRQLSTRVQGKKFFEEFTQSLSSQGYENILQMRKGNGGVQMFLKNENRPNGELIIILLEGDYCTMTGFNGNINLENMTALSKSLNVKGAEFIPQAKKK